MSRVTMWRRVGWSALAVVLALGWSVASIGPASASSDPATATFDLSGCGVAVVTVRNNADETITYFINLHPLFGRFYTLPPRETRVHKLRVSDNQPVSFLQEGQQQPVRETYDAPEGCPTAKLVTRHDDACVNSRVTVVNEGPAAAPDIQLFDSTGVFAAATIQPGGQLVGLTNPSRINNFIGFNVHQGSIDPPDFFVVDNASAPLPDCQGNSVVVADTCTGVHLSARIAGTADGTLVVDGISGRPAQEFTVPPTGLELDVPVPLGTMLDIGFRTFPTVVFHQHTVAPPCEPPASPSAPPTVEPSPPVEPSPADPAPSGPTPSGPSPAGPPPTGGAGGGGGLPLTGSATASAAAVGAGLLILGFTVLLIARRRRPTSPA